MSSRTRARRVSVCATALFVLVVVSASLPAASAVVAREDTGERRAVARLVSAAVEVSPPLARSEAGRQMVPRGTVLTREGELRPAADLGSWARSRGYERVSPELGDALAEGSAPDATTREWTRCYQRGNGAYVICPDGFIEVN